MILLLFDEKKVFNFNNDSLFSLLRLFAHHFFFEEEKKIRRMKSQCWLPDGRLVISLCSFSREKKTSFLLNNKSLVAAWLACLPFQCVCNQLNMYGLHDEIDNSVYNLDTYICMYICQSTKR